MVKKIAWAMALTCLSFSIGNAARLEAQPVRIAKAQSSPSALTPMVEYTLSFINGLWESEWGPVTFKASPRGDGSFNLSGYWIQSGKQGLIQKGNFDPSQGILRLAYYQSWNEAQGQAVFRLSSDKRILSGNYTQSNGGSGSWVLKRPGAWRLSAPPKQTAALQPQKPLPPQQALPPVATLPPTKPLPPASALPQAPASEAGAIPTGTSGPATIIQVPGSSGGIELRDEGCKKRLTTGADMLFEFDKSNLTERAVAALEVLGDAVKRYGLHPVIIEGHTDAIGTDEYNQSLSERRASTVKEWLLSHNFVAQQAAVVGRGEKQPVAPNNKEDGSDNPPGRALNRRVEVIVDTCYKYGADGVTIEVDEEGMKAISSTVDPDILKGIAYYNHGIDLMHDRQWEKAIKSFEQASSYKRDDFNTHRQLARCHLELNHGSEAVAELKRALSLNPDDEETRVLLKSAESH